MAKRRLGRSDLYIEPLVLGTTTVGWTADEPTSFALFDAFLDEGFSAIDTADVYSRWIPGNDSESEKIIGRWMQARGNRDKVLVFTKVGQDMALKGAFNLSAAYIEAQVETSLKRLQTDYIDLYQSHRPDLRTPQEETLRAHERLIRAGKVRCIGVCNQPAELLSEALAISARENLPRYETVQNEFSLIDRAPFEGAVQDICVREQVSGIHYRTLAMGFLAGKYRSADESGKSLRGKEAVSTYLNERGRKVLAAVDAVSKRTGATQAEIAMAWVAAQPGVAAPISSASSVEQVRQQAAGVRLKLSDADLEQLSEAGRLPV